MYGICYASWTSSKIDTFLSEYETTGNISIISPAEAQSLLENMLVYPSSDGRVPSPAPTIKSHPEAAPHCSE